MRRHRHLACLMLCPLGLLLVCAAAAATAAADWPSFRGPDHKGAVAAAGLFEGEQVGLEVAWRQRLGPGYSGITAADGRIFTMVAEGDDDVLVALDEERGTVLWRYRVGSRTRGHDGSEDGPIATPVTDGARVYSASTDGRLFSLDAATGGEVWSVDLVATVGVVIPLYDYGATPLLTGDLVVTPTPGAASGALTAFDRATGARRWSAAPGGVTEYQSPVAATLLGSPQILFWLQDRALGLDLEGRELWSHPAGPNFETSPLAIDDRRVLLYGGEQSTLLELDSAAGVHSVKKLWDSKQLRGGNFSMPVYHDGHLYGFDRQFLSCVDAATGERRWRSRPPGGSGLILVEDRLVVFGADGDVAVVRASPQAYTEETRIHATDRESLTWPAFAAGKVLVRDATHVAALRVTDQPTVAAARDEAPALFPGSSFTAFVERLQAAPVAEKQLLLDHFFRAHRSFPIFEERPGDEGDLVHFIYRGSASDVAVMSTIWDQQDEQPLVRVADTDFFYRSMQHEPAARIEYAFRVDLEASQRDPLNPRQVRHWGQMISEGLPPGASDADYLGPYVGEERGRIERFEHRSTHTGDAREIAVYLPATGPPTALVVVVDGPGWLAAGQLANSLDHTIGNRVAPIAVALVPAAQQLSFLENDGRNTPALARMLTEELVPELRRRFTLPAQRERTAVMGVDSAATGALFTALTHADVFGHALLLDYAGTFGLVDELGALLAGRPSAGAAVPTVTSLWNRHGYLMRPRGYDGREEAVELEARLRELGYPLAARERIDSYGWGAWRVMVIAALEQVFPANGGR